MDSWKHLLVVNKRKDEKEFITILNGSKKRSSPYLIEERQNIAELRDYYDELVKSPICVAMTLTYQREYDIYEDEQLRDITNDVLRFFDTKGYLFYPDIDNNGNRHYHGVIIMTLKEYAKFRRYMNIYVGYVKREYISDIEGWYLYMRKDKGFKSREHPISLIEPIYTEKEIINLCCTPNACPART